MKVKLMESSLPGELGATLRSKSFNLPDSEIFFLYDSLTLSMAYLLSLYKDKTKGSNAVSIKDYKGNFLLGMRADYQAPSDEGMPGSWSMVMTFNEDDIKDCSVVVDNSNLNFTSKISDFLFEMHMVRFSDATVCFDTIVNACMELKKHLDVNADNLCTSGEPYEIELDGFFTASVNIEDGKKVFGIVPSGAVTRIVKDDSGESVENVTSNNVISVSDALSTFKAAA